MTYTLSLHDALPICPGVEQPHFAPVNLEQRRHELRDRIRRQELPQLVLLVQVVGRCRSKWRKRWLFAGNDVRMDSGWCHKLWANNCFEYYNSRSVELAITDSRARFQGISLMRMWRYSIWPRSPSRPIGPVAGTFIAASNTSPLQRQYATPLFTVTSISFQSPGR